MRGELGGAGRKGIALAAIVLGLMVATVAVSTGDLNETRSDLEEVRARLLAQSGFERGMHLLRRAAGTTAGLNPLDGLRGLFGANRSVEPIQGEALLDGTARVGAISVRLSRVDEGPDHMTVLVEATGYLPDAPENLPAGTPLSAWHAVGVTVRFALAPAAVFDYAYFIDNWCWFDASTIDVHGAVRSNGQFVAAGHSPTVSGQPRYESVDWDGRRARLSGYRDDNGDGREDGNDGGIFSAWAIVGAENVRGSGGDRRNQHPFVEPLEMPNLNDLGPYEQRALGRGSSIRVGGSTVCDGVSGDGGGEQDNLYLVGTAADPIVLDGPVVVRGDVIISGYVTGQGAIYAGGNVYVPDSLVYVDGPTTPRPGSNDQAATEAWLATNWNRDFLGLFARENLVVGDHTSPSWRRDVGGWMSSPLNRSEEDAGEDGIPNTAAGRDGIPGTADDDVLEGDGRFSVETYTVEHASRRLVPPGYAVGDAIPGSGEDIDGDGAADDTTELTDIDFDVPLDPTGWDGNMPAAGIASYSSIASLHADRLDATLYTSHTFAWVVLGARPVTVNGAIVSRNEALIHATPKLVVNYDCRLLGGEGGVGGPLLPQELRPPAILRWRVLDRDPNQEGPRP